MSDQNGAAGHGPLRAYLNSLPRHGSTTDAVTDALREAILDGVLAPASWLREDELARELSVSRTPVREALKRLADEGLASRVANRGTVVAQMTLDDVLAVYLVRENLEGLAARTAAARTSPALVAALREVHGRMEAAAGDVPAVTRLNLEFHRVLRQGSGNPYLERFLTQVEHAVRRFGRSTYESPERSREALEEHRRIIEAIEAGDSDAAERNAVLHMRRAREARLTQILPR